MEASFDEVKKKSGELEELIRGNKRALARGGDLTTPQDVSEEVEGNSERFEQILHWLWDNVVRLVLEELWKVGDKSRRVWWFPSGEFTRLPIHAAAILHSDPESPRISSYTSTLGALIDSRKCMTLAPGSTSKRVFKLAAVRLEHCERLPELARLRGSWMSCPASVVATRAPKEVNVFKGQNAKVEQVKDAMNSSEIVHFVRHGVQDLLDPLDSRLILADGVLPLSILIEENLHSAEAEFAFLFACQTATGHRILTNEAVHLANGFVVAGFNAAEGLHHAVWEMIDRGVPPRAWTPLVHVGV
ncbi:hypothetical protein AN958_04489 [Leucoagaricus sp. SymC.cos]|nr:hypothetical protein AN958_04489 [Leucoagaricus sp. SymC.cos]